MLFFKPVISLIAVQILLGEPLERIREGDIKRYRAGEIDVTNDLIMNLHRERESSRA